MIWKRDPPPRDPWSRADRSTFHDWILSLPWVVERSYVAGVRGVRAFAIDCRPLDIRRMWLVTGLRHDRAIALIVDNSQAEAYEVAGVATPITPMPALHTMIGLSEDLGETDLERVILEVYGRLLS